MGLFDRFWSWITDRLSGAEDAVENVGDTVDEAIDSVAKPIDDLIDAASEDWYSEVDSDRFRSLAAEYDLPSPQNWDAVYVEFKSDGATEVTINTSEGEVIQIDNEMNIKQFYDDFYDEIPDDVDVEYEDWYH